MASKHRVLPVLFCLLFMAIGSIPLVLGVRGVQQARATLAWPTVTGRILRSEMRSEQSTSRDDKGRQRTTTYYYADVSYEYTVDGKSFTGTRIAWSDGQSGSEADAQAVIKHYSRDMNASVAYNPESPDQAVLEPGKWGNAGWLLLFGGLFISVPGLMAYGMLQEPKVEPEDDRSKARRLHEIVFRERILEWQPGSRIHLHRDHETLRTIVIGSVFVGLIFGLFVTMFVASFTFSRLGIMFVVKAYFVISAILALAFGISFGISHRRRDTLIDWGFHTVRAQFGWHARQFGFNQVEKLSYRSPRKTAPSEREGKLTARIDLHVDGRKYTILETEVSRQQAPYLRDKLLPILEPLSEHLGVPWSEQELTAPFAKIAGVANSYTGEDRELVNAIEQVGGRVVHRNNEIQEVDLSEVDGTDGIVEIVSHFSSLQRLAVKGKRVTDEAVHHLRHLAELRILDLESTSLSDVGAGSLRALEQLESLSLKGTRIGSAALRRIAALPVLEELNLAYTAIDDQALEYLAECENLDYLDLTGTNVTSDAVEELQKQLPDCSIATGEQEEV